jgi:hypothetical protein
MKHGFDTSRANPPAVPNRRRQKDKRFRRGLFFAVIAAVWWRGVQKRHRMILFFLARFFRGVGSGLGFP